MPEVVEAAVEEVEREQERLLDELGEWLVQVRDRPVRAPESRVPRLIFSRTGILPVA